jgi:hypothetical protein
VKSAAHRIRAVLAAVLVQVEAPELTLVHQWLDSWRGVGLLAVGLHRIGYDLDLRQYGDGHWCASFYVTGIAHSILGGSAWEPTAWRAVQRAAEGDVEDDMTPPRRAFPWVAVLLVMSGAAEFPPWVITNQDGDRVAGR